MRQIKDFVGFRFGNVHSSELNLLVVSSSDRYEKNLLPDPTDYTTEIPGSDGTYYFGQTYKDRTFTVNVAFDRVSEPIFRKISQLFANDKLQDLVFDEMPFKTYKAKIKSNPDFKFICFTDRDTGERVYKGEGTLVFICYFPYAFGFNKYVVRAADFYKCAQPKDIIINKLEDNPYRKKKKPKFWPAIIKDHYNVEYNMRTPWKGGYPTIEQVQWGELYFKGPEDSEKKMIIDVRNYWKNIPEWQGTAKLLTTPTLDYDQELIFAPQFSKCKFINMDTGYYTENDMMGSRILVYNPGDLPIEFELRMEENKRTFWSSRMGNGFRISRFNVERLSIEQAVDWTGLTTLEQVDDKPYKYGNRYFKLDDSEPDDTELLKNIDEYTNKNWLEEDVLMEEGDTHNYGYYDREGNEVITDVIVDGKEGNTAYTTPNGAAAKEVAYNLHLKEYQDSLYNFIDEKTEYRLLKAAHPHHTYIAEPIPRQKLGHYIKLFYWQSEQQFKDNSKKLANLYPQLKFEDGIKIANRYDELRSLCINEDEEYELYWETLKMAILDKYKDCNVFSEKTSTYYDSTYTYEDFVESFLYHPMEFITVDTDKELDYGQDTLNIYNYPQWITEDYLEIDPSALAYDEDYRTYNKTENMPDALFLDTEERILFENQNPDDFYKYKPTKILYNDSIKKGKWFKLPPGWSLIAIEPISDEEYWGGKRWLDARPFDWGYGGDENQNPREVQQLFNGVYDYCVNKFLKSSEDEGTYYKEEAFSRDNVNTWLAKGYNNGLFDLNGGKNSPAEKSYINNDNQPVLDTNTLDDEDRMKIRNWFFYYKEQAKSKNDTFAYQLYCKRETQAEYSFLKLLYRVWNKISPYYSWTAGKGVFEDGEDLDDSGRPKRCINAHISDWWYYACNYMWANFPPLYWGLADLLNGLQIKYVPLFY